MKFSAANKFLSFLTAEWQKKLVSALFAAFLWYYVQSTTTTEQTFSLPIQFLNLPPGLVVLETSDTAVSIVVKGKSDTVKNLNAAKTIKPVVYLDGAKTGTNYQKIELTLNEPLPDTIINLQKDRVRVRLDRLTERVVAVQPRIGGVPRDGYFVTEVLLDRREVQAQGPQEILSALEYLETQTVDVSQATNEFSRAVTVSVPKLVSVVGSDRVTLTVRIGKKAKEQGPAPDPDEKPEPDARPAERPAEPAE